MAAMLLRSLGHRAPLLWLVLPLMAGLYLSDTTQACTNVSLLCAALGLLSLAYLAVRSECDWPWIAAISGAMFLAGSVSYRLHRNFPEGCASQPPRETVLQVRIERLFAQSSASKVSGIGVVTGSTAIQRELLGQRIYFSLRIPSGALAPVRTGAIEAGAVLTPLTRHPPLDTFEGYLAGAGVNFTLNRGKLLREIRPAGAYYRWCDRTLRRCKQVLGAGIAAKRPELAALLRALILGETRELSDEQRALFMQSGTMHLFAISGLNIAVIAGTLQAFLILLRFPAWLRWCAATPLLWLFVDITGAAPSAVRAFAMATFLQAAFTLRKPANPLAAVTISTLAVLIAAPLQVFSASFLMSYGIVIALLLLGLPLAETCLAWWTPWRSLPSATWTRWHRLSHRAWLNGMPAVIVGVATLPVTLISGVMFFHLLTPGALFANFVLIPTAMIATLGGFVSLLCGLSGWESGAVLCNHAAALTLWLIEKVVRLSVAVPGAFLPATFTATWVGPFAFGLVVALLLFGYAVRWRWRFGGWLLPFAVVGAMLVWGMRFGSG